MLLIRHASGEEGDFEPALSETSSTNNLGKRLVSTQGAKSPELMKEIRETKAQSGKHLLLDPTASTPGRFSFLRRNKKPAPTPTPSVSSNVVELLTETTFFPKRGMSKDFEFDMDAELEHEIERRAKPGSENIWA